MKITKHQDINQKEATKIKIKRPKTTRRVKNTRNFERLGNMLTFTYHANNHDNITRFCHREIACHANLQDIIPSSKFSKTLWRRILLASKKYKQSEQKHIKLSDMIN